METFTESTSDPTVLTVREVQVNHALAAAKGQLILSGHAHWCVVQTTHHNSANEIVGGHCACGWVQTMSLINHCIGIEDK